MDSEPIEVVPIVIVQTPEEVKDEFDLIRELLSAGDKEQQRLESKPDLSKHVDAVVYLEDKTPVFVPDVGEKVIIERYATVLKSLSNNLSASWLDTREYRVKSVNHETGDLWLFDLELQQNSTSNFITGISDHGYKFKLPSSRGLSKGRRKRRGRKAQLLDEQLSLSDDKATQSPVYSTQTPNAGGKKGRPKGATNRPKDVIAAEKLAKQKQRAEKKQRRAS